MTNSSLNRMGIYAALGVPEVWRLDDHAFRFRLDADNNYRRVDVSPTFPGVTPGDLMPFLREAHEASDQNQVTRRFREWIGSGGRPIDSRPAVGADVDPHPLAQQRQRLAGVEFDQAFQSRSSDPSSERLRPRPTASAGRPPRAASLGPARSPGRWPRPERRPSCRPERGGRTPARTSARTTRGPLGAKSTGACRVCGPSTEPLATVSRRHGAVGRGFQSATLHGQPGLVEPAGGRDEIVLGLVDLGVRLVRLNGAKLCLLAGDHRLRGIQFLGDGVDFVVGCFAAWSLNKSLLPVEPESRRRRSCAWRPRRRPSGRRRRRRYCSAACWASATWASARRTPVSASAPLVLGIRRRPSARLLALLDRLAVRDRHVDDFTDLGRH